MATLTELRDDAFSASQDAHNRMKREMAIYKNEGYLDGSVSLGSLKPLVQASLDPKVTNAINRMLPAFLEQTARIEIQADRHAQNEEEFILVQDLQNWMDMMDEVDSEASQLNALVTHNLAIGNTIGKVFYDWKHGVVRAPPIDPLTFAPDPRCTRMDFADADYVCQTNWHRGMDIKDDYDIPMEDVSDWERAGHRVDEMWLTKEKAEDCGVNIKNCRTPMVLATLINDKISRVQESPFWWPGFPYVAWRNFLNLLGDGKPHDFWGYGYGTLMWPQQKLLDELLANLVLINRNISVGRFITTHGTLDRERILAEHGIIVELNEGKNMDDLQHLPPEELPAALVQFVLQVSQTADGMAPSLNPVFTGDAPFSGASGRAVNNLQAASFNQLSGNVAAMNEFRLRRARIKVTMIQQFARKPLKPHLWRGGLDLPEVFPDDARKIGYQLVMPDSTSIPNTIAGKLQVVQFLQSSGYSLAPDRLLEFIGLDRGFGLKAEDLLVPGIPQGGGQMDEEVLSGQEAALSAER